KDLDYPVVVVLIGIIIFFLALITFKNFFKLSRHKQYGFYFYSAVLMFMMVVIITLGRYFSLGSSRYAVYTAFLATSLLLLVFAWINQETEGHESSRNTIILLVFSTLSLAHYLVALRYHHGYLVELEWK